MDFDEVDLDLDLDVDFDFGWQELVEELVEELLACTTSHGLELVASSMSFAVSEIQKAYRVAYLTKFVGTCQQTNSIL